MVDRIDHVEGQGLFGRVADTYDAIRPDYPAAVYAFIEAETGIRDGTRTLEIGAGNGLATRKLIQLGANPITVIEPDKGFNGLLQTVGRSFPGTDLRLVTQAFEKYSPQGSRFDLITAATVFHWLEPASRMKRIAQLLVPGGHVALWWNVFQDTDQVDEFHDATVDILRDLDASPSNLTTGIDFALDIQALTKEFTSAGFSEPKYQIVKWTLRLKTIEAGALYSTFSSISRLPEQKRKKVLNDLMQIAETKFNGIVERHMTSIVYVSTLL